MTLSLSAEHLLRELAPQVLGSVCRRFADFAACEDATQEALIAAAEQWPRDGVPDNPRGWLIQVALRRMTDRYAARLHDVTARIALPPKRLSSSRRRSTANRRSIPMTRSSFCSCAATRL